MRPYVTKAVKLTPIASLTHDGKTLVCYAFDQSATQKFNPNHDERGRFAEGSGGAEDRALNTQAEWGQLYDQAMGTGTEADAHDAYYVYDAEGNMRARALRGMGEYDSARAQQLQDDFQGGKISSEAEAQARVDALLATYGPKFDAADATVEMRLGKMDDGAIGVTDPQYAEHSYRITLDPSWATQSVLIHELSHVFGAETSGVVGHGASFRSAYNTVLKGELPDYYKAYIRQGFVGANRALTKFNENHDEHGRFTYGSDGDLTTRIKDAGLNEADGITSGEAAILAPNGKLYSGSHLYTHDDISRAMGYDDHHTEFEFDQMLKDGVVRVRGEGNQVIAEVAVPMTTLQIGALRQMTEDYAVRANPISNTPANLTIEYWNPHGGADGDGKYEALYADAGIRSEVAHAINEANVAVGAPRLKFAAAAFKFNPNHDERGRFAEGSGDLTVADRHGAPVMMPTSVISVRHGAYSQEETTRALALGEHDIRHANLVDGRAVSLAQERVDAQHRFADISQVRLNNQPEMQQYTDGLLKQFDASGQVTLDVRLMSEEHSQGGQVRGTTTPLNLPPGYELGSDDREIPDEDVNDHHYTVELMQGCSLRTAVHEVAHALAIDNTGYIGHGQSFRDTYYGMLNTLSPGMGNAMEMLAGTQQSLTKQATVSRLYDSRGHLLIECTDGATQKRNVTKGNLVRWIVTGEGSGLKDNPCDECVDLDGGIFDEDDLPVVHGGVGTCQCYLADTDEDGNDLNDTSEFDDESGAWADKFAHMLFGKFNENHDEHGRFTFGSGQATRDDLEHVGGGRGVTPRTLAAADATLAAHGMTRQDVATNLKSYVDRSGQTTIDSGQYKGESARDVAAHWYADAQAEAIAMGAANGFGPVASITAVANCSPQTSWETSSAGTMSNLNSALGCMDAVAQNPDVTIDGQTQPFTSLDPQTAAGLVPGGTPNDQQAKAITILENARSNGGEVDFQLADQVTSGMKVRSFATNMLDPTNTEAVTVDGHYGHLALGNGWTDNQVLNFVRTPGGYEIIAQATRDIASQEGVPPNQLQAAAWMVHVDEGGPSSHV